MNSGFNFVADKVTKGRIYPALSQHEARPYTQAWREFGNHWPWTTPLRLQEYCDSHGYPINIFTVEQAPQNAFYPIGIGFFDFEIDYIGLVPPAVKRAVTDGRLKLLFYYHEGDNPLQIKSRLDKLCQHHGLNLDCYVFVSSNSRADNIDNFVWFADFELWYYQRNLMQPALNSKILPRQKDFVALSRVHKSWRATVMADLYRDHLLDNSYWSYCQRGELAADNPIEIDLISRLRWDTQKFLESAPYFADDLEDAQRNDHSVTVSDFFENAWANIALESQMDVDQSSGSFLTEKTFKPIKHGQVFWIVGAAGSLAQLRSLGYRTFDSVIDTSYDAEPDATLRWQLCKQSIAQAHDRGLAKIFEQCQADVVHNQQLFTASKYHRLNNLKERLDDINN